MTTEWSPNGTHTENTLSRNDAIARINDMVNEEGIESTFKVYYQGRQIVRPSDLPDEVNMELVDISATLDQA